MTKNKTKIRFRGMESERDGQEEVPAAAVTVQYQQ
jgi:hypothetical protein